MSATKSNQSLPSRQQSILRSTTLTKGAGVHVKWSTQLTSVIMITTATTLDDCFFARPCLVNSASDPASTVAATARKLTRVAMSVPIAKYHEFVTRYRADPSMKGYLVIELSRWGDIAIAIAHATFGKLEIKSQAHLEIDFQLRHQTPIDSKLYLSLYFTKVKPTSSDVIAISTYEIDTLIRSKSLGSVPIRIDSASSNCKRNSICDVDSDSEIDSDDETDYKAVDDSTSDPCFIADFYIDPDDLSIRPEDKVVCLQEFFTRTQVRYYLI